MKKHCQSEETPSLRPLGLAIRTGKNLADQKKRRHCGIFLPLTVQKERQKLLQKNIRNPLLKFTNVP